MKYTIYTLREEGTNNIFYVGITKRDILIRLSGHLSGPANKVCGQEIDRIISQNGAVIIEMIDETDNKHDEYYWMDQLRGMGFGLLNAKYEDFYLRQYLSIVESRLDLSGIRIKTTQKYRTLNGDIVTIVRSHMM